MATALVFGGSGQLGFAVADHLLNLGWRVHIATRGERTPAGSLLRRGAQPIDATGRTRREVFKETNLSVDAVFDPTCYQPSDAADLLSARDHFHSLVVVSSSSVYADPCGRTLDEAVKNGFPIFEGPISEDNATVSPGIETYSELKVGMEKRLLEGELPITILRPCAIYGRFGRHPREWWFVKRALDGRRRLPVAYNAESRFHTSSAVGIATLARICMELPATRILNVADPEAPTVRRIAGAIGDAIGFEFDLLPFAGGGEPPAYAGCSPWSTERPFTLDTGKAKQLGWDGGMPYEVGVVDVCRWLVDTARTSDWWTHFTKFLEYGRDPFDYRAEDKLIDLLEGNHS